jgi:predicted nucleotide-binding protein
VARRTRKPEPEKVAAQLDQRQLMAAAPKLQRRIDELQKLEQEEISSYDDPRTSAARMKLDDTLVSIFGADSLDYDRYQVHSLANMGPMTFGGGPTPPQQIIENYKGGIREAITKTQTALDMVDERIAENNHTEGTDNTPGPVPAAAIRLSRRVFVVHGHDGEAKVQVARFLEKLTLEPVILHEQPNKGRTIIEKFEDYSDVGFAVVLMTPDDIGGTKSQEDAFQARARQNVVFELGYFAGKLGRSRVCALLSDSNIEKPSDIAGVVYLEMDGGGAWQLDLFKEIRAAGIEVDANAII